jgi:hypothetical protein
MAANSTLCAKHGGRCRWRWRGSRGGCRTKFGSSGIHIGQSTGNGILENGATDLTVPFTLDTFWNSGDRRHCYCCHSPRVTTRHMGFCPMERSGSMAKLWEALSEHTLQATGISTDERVAIPDYAWHDLQDIEERGRDVLRVRETSGVWNDRGYDDVALRRQNIMSIWQPHRLEEQRYQLPALVKPEGPGYMPLYFAAQWIATRGGTVEIDPSELSVWQDAFAQLLPRFASEQIKVIGVRNGVTETISALHFASCRVDYPYSDADFDLILSEEFYLCSYPYIDDEHWRRAFDDSLRNRSGKHWERLMVLKSDVAHHWPFSLAQATGKTPGTTYQSGAPGRPTSMHLVEVEFRARWDRGDAKTSIGAEAQILSEWLQKKHPDAPQLTPKAIANRLRHEHRRRGASAQN